MISAPAAVPLLLRRVHKFDSGGAVIAPVGSQVYFGGHKTFAPAAVRLLFRM